MTKLKKKEPGKSEEEEEEEVKPLKFSILLFIKKKLKYAILSKILIGKIR